MNVLIIGLGSIAQKHIHVLRELVPEVSIFALRSSLNARSQSGITNIYSLEDIQNYNFHFALICSPSKMHLQNIKDLLPLRIPIMVEKPLFVSQEQIRQFESEFKPPFPLIYVACNLRFHPLILFLKDYLKKEQDKIYEVNAYCGSYLPNWRPNQDYRLGYSAIKELGGGVHLDLIHEPDYLIYLFGSPVSTKSSNRKVSHLEIDTIDSSNYLFQYPDFQAQITLNYFRRDTKRVLEIVRENDTLLVDFLTSEVKNLTTSKIVFKAKEISMYATYERQMQYFLSCIKEGISPMNSVDEAIDTLKFVL